MRWRRERKSGRLGLCKLAVGLLVLAAPPARAGVCADAAGGPCAEANTLPNAPSTAMSSAWTEEEEAAWSAGAGSGAHASKGPAGGFSEPSAIAWVAPESDDDRAATSRRSATRRAAADGNRDIYFQNKLEFSLEGGWLPLNIPFVFDFLLGGGYNVTGLDYTLVPIIASVRWHLNDVGGRGVLRGNWDFTASGVFTAIPRGPESRFLGYAMGIRRNFVPRRWKAAPYLDGRLGIGGTDARAPRGVPFAQGQDLTFTLMLGGGVRYNFNSRYSIEGGLNYMHISNLYLSEPKYPNYGINVYGPMFGLNVQLGRRRGQAARRGEPLRASP